MATPYVRPTHYIVNLLPDTVPDADVFEISVEWRGDDRWAVLRHGRCLGTDGEWDYEVRPSEREDDWLAEHRFDVDTAIRLAKEKAPHVTVNGLTAADALARLLESGELAHLGGNAEDCPACHGTNPDYPFICPGPTA
ncbi:hypothetical protein AB0C91_10325 [Streptomyces sp. NPDC048674]|uniref:hypothetical protein n=1 Tax=Streptomyces sp. NPDC048674 TaxID=3155491 RepID=UPI00343DE8BF